MINKQKIFSVYIKPDDTSWEKVEFVQEGFSLGTFIIDVLWLLFNKLWVFSALIIALLVTIHFANTYNIISYITAKVLSNAILIWAAFEFADWRCKKMERQGYVLYDIIVANKKSDAEVRFFDRHLPLKYKAQNLSTIPTIEQST